MEKQNENKSYLRKLWENVCNAYLSELARMWDWDIGSGDYWVADEKGGVFIYNESVFINFDDMRYCVEHDITEEKYQEFFDYGCKAAELGLDRINIQSWFKGCPRASEESIDRLIEMKKELYREIEKTRNLQSNAGSF